MSFFYKFVNPKYLFEPTPPFPFKFFLPVLIFFGLILVVGISLPILIKRRHKKTPPFEKLAGKIQTPLIIFSLFGFLLLFFRWQAIPYLSARILVLILLLSIFWWLIYFIIYLKKDFQKELILWQNHLRKMKYLPKGAKK